MTLVQILLVFAGLFYIFIGWKMFAPMGWYFGKDDPRAIWKDTIYIILFVCAVLLWSLIVIGGLCYIAIFKRKL